MFPRINTEKTAKQIKYYMERKQISHKELAEKLYLGSVQTIYKWTEGRSVPSLENLVVLAKYLGVGVDDILVIENDTGE